MSSYNKVNGTYTSESRDFREMVEKEEDVKARIIQSSKVVFTPGKCLNNNRQTMTYEKIAK